MRAFLAIDLPEPARVLLGACCDLIRAASPAWRDEKWVRPENLHVTLRFLGEIADSCISEITDVVAEAAGGADPLTLHPSAIVARPRTRSATMLWMLLADSSGRAGVFASALEAGLTRAGWPPSEHPFRPHVTLVRARRARAIGPETLADATSLLASAAPMSAGHVTLYSSTFAPRGPVYSVIARIALGSD